MDKKELSKKITAMVMPFIMGAFILGNIVGIVQGKFLLK